MQRYSRWNREEQAGLRKYTASLSQNEFFIIHQRGYPSDTYDGHLRDRITASVMTVFVSLRWTINNRPFSPHESTFRVYIRFETPWFSLSTTNGFHTCFDRRNTRSYMLQFKACLLGSQTKSIIEWMNAIHSYIPKSSITSGYDLNKSSNRPCLNPLRQNLPTLRAFYDGVMISPHTLPLAAEDTKLKETTETQQIHNPGTCSFGNIPSPSMIDAQARCFRNTLPWLTLSWQKEKKKNKEYKTDSGSPCISWLL